MRIPYFRTLLIDPAWPERGGGRIRRGANRHYNLLTVKQIPLVIMQSPGWRISSGCHLYLWATNNYLFKAMQMMQGELGFRYIHPVTWTKTKSGLGQYRGGRTEHMLFGVFGEAMMPEEKLRHSTWLGNRDIPATTHSRKPQEQYTNIEGVSPGPYCELFATQPRPGWHSWGTFDGPGTDPYMVRMTKRGKLTRVT